jgi:Protein of unknown function (DUF723)
LQCHHLNAWNWCVEGRYDINNGILIRKDIHRQFHSIFGANVKIVDFEQYLIQYHEWGDKPFPWRHGNHEPSLSVEALVDRGISVRKEKFDEFLNICASRHHQLVEGEYINVKSPITIRCEIHGNTFETTFHNYKRSKHGLPCCGSQAVRDFSNKAKRNNKGRFTSN